MFKKLLLVFGPLLAIAVMGATYNQFSPGGALFGTWNSQSVDLTATGFLTGPLPGTKGGTNNSFFQIIGPTTTLKSYTLPDASTVILTTASPVTVAQGGTGLTTGNSGGIPFFDSTTSMQSSATLGNMCLVIGAGAGNSPITDTDLTWDSVNNIMTMGSTATPAQLLGAPGTAANGATLIIRAGAAGTTNVGGALTISGGPGGATSGNGGAITVTGGTPVDGNGGSATLSAANGVGTNRNGGTIGITAGQGVGSGTPGAILITAGRSAAAGGTVNGASLTASAGAGGGTSGNGGSLTFNAGSATEGNGGQLTFTAKSGSTGTATARNGGNITMNLGAGVSGGTDGFLSILGITAGNVMSVQPSLQSGNVQFPFQFAIGSSGGDYPFAGYNTNTTTSVGTYNYLTTDFASRIQFPSGGFKVQTAPSGSAGAAITFTDRLAVTQTGAVSMPSLASSSAPATGSVCWTTGGNLTVDTTLACLSSTIKIKQNIEPLNVGLDEVLNLKPISYRLKPEFDQFNAGYQMGFIAEDVNELDPRLVALDDKGDPRGVRYMQLTALLAKALQEEDKKVAQQQWEIYGLMLWCFFLSIPHIRKHL